MNKQTQLPGKAHNGDSVLSETPSQAGWGGRDLTPLLHRRAVEIHQRLRTVRSQLTTTSQRAVFDYIVDNTIGRNKDSDQIANSQFMNGKRCSKTGKVIDFGCGLRSINTIRRARKTLISLGLIFEESETDITGASEANRYGLVFIRDLLELIDTKHLSTRRGYQKMTPTIKTPTEFTKQRCGTTAKNQKKKTIRRYHMHPDHVDYLVDQIENTTGDTHSRGAFAEIALTVDEGIIMELLAAVRDRDNINNRGAWFLSAARRYQKRRIIRADKVEPVGEGDSISPAVSLRDLLATRKPELANMLDMNRSIPTNAIHQKFIVGK